MTEMTCLHCGASTSNGLALCERCRVTVQVDLEFLPIYFRNLSRWRPGRAGSRPVPGSRPPTSTGTMTIDPVAEALDEVGAEFTAWARCLSDDRPHLARVVQRILGFEEEQCFRLLCMLFERRLTTIGTVPWAGEFAAATGKQEAILRALTEKVVPGWYAGACWRKVSEDQTCGAPTYVVPGLTWVTCGRCGSTTYARDHLDTILTEARDWVARPMRLAEAIVALVDGELSVTKVYDRIKKWGDRERIPTMRQLDDDGDAVGPKRYRFGDVLDRLFIEGATRLDESTPLTSPATG